jgi:hypothetical protein
MARLFRHMEYMAIGQIADDGLQVEQATNHEPPELLSDKSAFP